MSIGKLFHDGLPFSNVVGDGVATCNITPGRTIEAAVLELGHTGAGAFTKAMISLIKLKANGKVIWEATGTQIDKMNAFRGLAADAAFLPLFFTDIKGRDKVDQMVGAFDTSKGIVNITMEVTIAGATTPTLKLHLQESAAQTATYSPVISKVLRYPYNIGSGGRLPVQLPFGSTGAVLKKLHVEQATANNVTAATLKQDGLVVHESTEAANNFLNSVYGRTNQANWYSIDFGIDENSENLLDTRDMRSLEFLLDFAAADAGFIIAEYLDVLGNL